MARIKELASAERFARNFLTFFEMSTDRSRRLVDPTMQADLIKALDTELAKHGHEKRCPMLKQLYQAQQEQVQRKDAGSAIWFVGALYVLFSLTDAILIGDIFIYAVTLRIAVGIV